ncbi:hypothetical protein [Haloarcula argentinensis]|uniref:Halobacterial output domain-containing protein n=1 Tax=Haloarcula argentinensis TaxID=43776 RepID=A0ABU2F780_HALAR|nr:hypothetical protein [Haloarcula argentinensis]EMA25223.1 hypothetical protein C443_03469 [Haloarcula argentinensis DSM 12282]MDS0255981.1 hypothetical protein [Haloarcula argentinensis]
MTEPTSEVRDGSATNRNESPIDGQPIAVAKPPSPFVWKDEVVSAFDGAVTVRPESARYSIAGKVVDGAEYLVATARETFTPPTDYQFQSWDVLQSGRLALRSGEPQFPPADVSRAVATLAKHPAYQPERFTIFYRGCEPVYIEGPDAGIVITPW